MIAMAASVQFLAVEGVNNAKVTDNRVQGSEFVKCTCPYLHPPLVLLASSRFHVPGRCAMFQHRIFLEVRRPTEAELK